MQTRLKVPHLATLMASATLAVVVAVAIAFAPGNAEAQSPPATPASVTLNRADGTVTASGYAVSGATKYHITYSSDGKKSWSLAAFNHTSSSITFDATNSKTYVVAVRAGNDAGWSGWRNSAPIGPYVDPAVTPPSAPSAVYVRHKGHIVNFSWNTPSGATSYNVNGSANNKASWTRLASGYGKNKAHIKAKANKTYWIAVQACNSGGCSGWTNSGPATLPKPVSNLQTTTTTADGTSRINATWSAASKAKAYNVNHSSDGGKSWKRIHSNQKKTSAKIQLKSSSVNEHHIVAVQAVNGHSTSHWRNAGATLLTTSETKDTSATLAISNHYHGEWWLKNHIGNIDCVKKAGKSAAIDTLRSSTSYTYTAHGSANCPENSRLASVTFSTANANQPIGGNVSNLAKESDTLGQGVWHGYAVGFRTSNNPGGYILDSVTMRFMAKQGTASSFTAKIVTPAENDEPNESAVAVCELAGSSNPSEATDYVYEATSDSCKLAASTHYFILMNQSDNASRYENTYVVDTTLSNNEVNQPSGYGWRIADKSYRKYLPDKWLHEEFTSLVKLDSRYQQ